MKAAAGIAKLDRQIAKHGQPVTLVRQVANGDPVEYSTRAFVRGYRAEELTSEITVGASLVVLSPSNLDGGPFAAGIERQTDGALINGTYRKVIVPDPVEIDGKIVRWNLTVV